MPLHTHSLHMQDGSGEISWTEFVDAMDKQEAVNADDMSRVCACVRECECVLHALYKYTHTTLITIHHTTLPHPESNGC